MVNACNLNMSTANASSSAAYRNPGSGKLSKIRACFPCMNPRVKEGVFSRPMKAAPSTSVNLSQPARMRNKIKGFMNRGKTITQEMTGFKKSKAKKEDRLTRAEEKVTAAEEKVTTFQEEAANYEETATAVNEVAGTAAEIPGFIGTIAGGIETVSGMVAGFLGMIVGD